MPNDISAEIEEDSYTEVKVSKKDEKDTTYDVSCLTNKIGKTKGSKVNITCESGFTENDEIGLYRDDKGYSGYVKIIYEGNIDIISGTDDATTDKKDDGDNGGNDNGDGVGENSSYYYYHRIIVYSLLLILL